MVGIALKQASFHLSKIQVASSGAIYLCLMFRISKYWLFQLTGWMSFALFNIYIATLTAEFNRDILITNLLISLIGFLLSHLFRNAILKYRLNTFPTEKLLFIVFLAIVLLSVSYTALYYCCLHLVYDTTVFSLRSSEYLGSFFSIFFLFSIWSVIYFAWTYVESNRRNLIDKLRMESSVKDLELRTIRSNLQPHFLFNSLNSIRALIDENPEQARKAITRISNILRKSITVQEATDTLENEMRVVDDYMALEKIRFEERLSYKKTIDPNTLSLMIPAMMLQTLAENAIKHGIAKLEQGGEVRIVSSLQKDGLHLEVINSGTLQLPETNEHNLGFGLSSSRQRLNLLYDDKASLQMFERDREVHIVIIIQQPQTSTI